MNKKENIVLDARIVNVLGHAAFEAVLENGHEFVAFIPGAGRTGDVKFDSGARVRVEMSPYDMSKGVILR